jgi:hypothetical protein
VPYFPDKIRYDRNHHESLNYQGINYLIHNPHELLSKLSAKHQTVANYSMIVYLNPQITDIEVTLNGYEPKRFETILRFLVFEKLQFCRRGCYLKAEKHLKFFTKYTKNSCKSECLSNRTVAVCGCAQFFMVREKSTRICGVNDMKCYKKVEEESHQEDFCECLLECGEIQYRTKQQQNNFAKY